MKPNQFHVHPCCSVVQEFRDHFLPIEKGENALLESNFQIFLVDKGAWAENVSQIFETQFKTRFILVLKCVCVCVGV